ncbi:MAG TPA: GDSL-type esterase/lipase family protein [Bryobacteraceae bacterium]|jgi:lysophospholipase L1-like esterase|nr:GDSL-type esterase/lipase family protein [Bryobacteraceae bacterium]
MLPRKTSFAILTLGAFILLLEAAKLARPFTPAEAIDFRPRNTPAIEPIVPIPKFTTPAAGSKHPILEPNLIDPHDALRAFYLSLWRTELGAPGAITRVLHYGDSPVTADSITADVRSLLQQHFGDSGHGFVLIAKPWAWYGHRGVELQGKGWLINAASQTRARDGFHGLGGVSFEGDTGASSHLELAEDHALMEIHFLRQPGGGVLKVEAAGQALGSVETDGPTKEPAYQTFPLNAGMRDINLSVERGPVRMFGVSFEKNTPGVIYNSLGLNGGQVQFIVRYFDKPQWTEELEHQHPDLVVINYGTNESIYADYIERYYPGELRQVIERVKAAVPRASVLIMSPMDRGQRDSNARITTVPTLPKLVDIQRQMAQETGCAFFNTFQAMGGEGTMARWYDSTPRLVSADFTHPLPAGARKVGVLLDQALESGYRKFKAREQQRSAHQ